MEEKFSPKDAFDYGELGGVGAAGGGAGMPLGGGDLALGGPGQFSDLSAAGEMGATGADFGGGGMALTGATAGSPGGGMPGMGEAEVKDDKTVLTEAPISLDDIKPAAVRYDDETIEDTPDDLLFLNQDPIKGGMKITLKMIKDVRKSHMSRRVEKEKRLKMIQKVYSIGGEEEGGLGGGLGGLGGGLGGGGLI